MICKACEKFVTIYDLIEGICPKCAQVKMVRYREALERIAMEADCEGPGCPYCEREDMQHPYTAVAKLAQEALKN